MAGAAAGADTAGAPGIASGALMVFVMSLGYYVTPSLLGGTANMMLAELIVQQVQSLLNWGMGGAAAFLLRSSPWVFTPCNCASLNRKRVADAA
jgi:ABC-type spermidine/putrescine transport system permease subunit I